MILKNLASHNRLLALSIPMILANITTPLVGLVDTAVLGRMDSPAVLAGASIATIIITQIVWVCGFLRMSATGLSAQAFGSDNTEAQTKVLWQGLYLSVLLAVFLLVLQQPLFSLGVMYADLSGDALLASERYFYTRIWGLPAAMLNLTLIGWMVGRQLARQVMFIQIVGNILNAVLNLFFVFVLDWHIEGVAFATVCAEYVMLGSALWICLAKTNTKFWHTDWFSITNIHALLSLNTAMFIRNIMLQICLAFLTLQGARYGVLAASSNAIILQFFALIALGLDGIAYGVEALVGKAKGAQDKTEIKQSILLGLFWSSVLALSYAIVFGLGNQWIAQLLTQHETVLTTLKDYSLIIILLPLVGHWCFLFDGVAIGLTQAKAMRNSMIFSAIVGFFPVWWTFSNLQNKGLWIAMLSFLAFRGVTLGLLIIRQTFYVQSK